MSNITTTDEALTAAGPACHDSDKAVGLSLWWQDGVVKLESGTPAVVPLYEDFPRYMQELDITSHVETTTDQGIQPIIASGDMADLDWSGVTQVDEDWRPELGSNPTTYSRSKFYRNARWMERESFFLLIPEDSHGRPVGPPILDLGGTDDKWRSSDDGFIRRFDARQITPGCRAIGDCSNATKFIAQGLMQLRDAQHAAERARRIPRSATQLSLVWSRDPLHKRTVPIAHKSYRDTPYRYGFTPEIEVLTPPANGSYYVPNEALDLRFAFRDGDGNRLNPEGSLPSYSDFTHDNVASGLRYYDGLSQLLTLYYALKHREGMMIWNVAGPTDKLKYSNHVVPDADFFIYNEVPMATVAENGFTSVFNIIPSAPFLVDPVGQTLPQPDVIHFVVPAEAQPGTYVISLKGRRDWGGEAINRGVTKDIQVGQAAPSKFTPKTGNCKNCHNDESGFDKVLHRIDDRRACYGCHAPLGSEPDHALDYRIHLIHTRSERFPANPYDCKTCHLSTPTGPARGFPGVSDY
jgi:predicted CXXCH cytochrome family protein